MAALSKAPTELVIKATDARNKLKALLAANKIDYVRIYSSFDTRLQQVRVKFYYVNQSRLTGKTCAAADHFGFKRHRSDFSGVVSFVGYF
ncbi:hypothetical protein D3C80_659900 [compost metagenome]